MIINQVGGSGEVEIEQKVYNIVVSKSVQTSGASSAQPTDNVLMYKGKASGHMTLNTTRIGNVYKAIDTTASPGLTWTSNYYGNKKVSRSSAFNDGLEISWSDRDLQNLFAELEIPIGAQVKGTMMITPNNVVNYADRVTITKDYTATVTANGMDVVMTGNAKWGKTIQINGGGVGSTISTSITCTLLTLQYQTQLP